MTHCVWVGDLFLEMCVYVLYGQTIIIIINIIIIIISIIISIIIIIIIIISIPLAN